jgi:hypothetical protein
MRPTFVHVLTGLLLGTALAGLLNVPGHVVAHQASIPPVRTPNVAKPAGETVVRVSPEVEASLEAEARQARRPAKPEPRHVPAAASPVLVQAPVPVATPKPSVPQFNPRTTQKPVKEPEPPPDPEPAPPPPAEPPPAEPAPPPPATKVVLGTKPSDDEKHKKHKKEKKAKKPKKEKRDPIRGKSEEVHGRGHDGDHGNDEEHDKGKDDHGQGGNGNGNGNSEDKDKGK